MIGLAIVWGVPVAALIATSSLGHPVKTIAWGAALIWMGIACIANALRCGRLHCYLTGPFFLIMAAAVLLHGFGIVPLGADGWRWLGRALAIGSVILWFGPELVWGKYRRVPAERKQ